ncbi:MAG: ABC transporter substrate-binding protein [Gemmataceae bacterium]
MQLRRRSLFLGTSALVLGGAAMPAENALTVAIPSNINTLDPAKTKLGEEYIICYLVFSGVTDLDRAGRAAPDLAESWQASEDLKSWTFKLRSGVKFHNGRPLEAADVKATIERVMDKATASVARVNFDIVKSIEIPEPLTVRFNLNIPYSGFAEILADRQTRILPRGSFDTIAAEPIGTGPFKFVLSRPSDRIVLAKNPDYFAPGTPKLDRVVLRIMPETAAQVAAIKTGEVDLIWNLAPEVVSQFKNNPKIHLDSVATSTWDGLIMNGAHKPFDDIRVRRAVELALDKAALVQFALYGQGSASHSMIPPGSAYYNSDFPIPAPDVPRAKKLLAEAGFPNGFTATLYLPSGRPTRVGLGLGAAQFLQAAGIKVQMQQVPWDQFVKEIEGKAAFYTDGFYSRPTIDTSIYPFYDSAGSWNTTLWNYKNPKMDHVLDAARGARSDAERVKLYKQFQVLAVDEPAGVIPYVTNHVNALSDRVHDFHSSPMMWLDLRQVTVS